MDSELLRQLELLDPVAGLEVADTGLWEADTVLAEVERRATGASAVAPARPSRAVVRRGVLVALIAFVAVLAVVGALAFLRGKVGPQQPAEEPTSTTSPAELAPEFENLPILRLTPVGSGAPDYGTGEEAQDSGLAGLRAPVFEITSDASGRFIISGETEDGPYAAISSDGQSWQTLQLPEGFWWFGPLRSMDGKWIAAAQYADVGTTGVVVSDDGTSWRDYPVSDSPLLPYRSDYTGCGRSEAVNGDTVVVVDCALVFDHLYDLGVLAAPKRRVCDYFADGSVLEVYFCDGDGEELLTIHREDVALTADEWKTAIEPQGQLSAGVASGDGIMIEPTSTIIQGSVTEVVAVDDGFLLVSEGRTGGSLYRSFDGLNWSPVELPPQSRLMAIDGGPLLAVAADASGEGSAILASTNGVDWAEQASFVDRNVWSADAAASGVAATTLPGNTASGLPEGMIGWSIGGADWVWSTWSAALGGDPGDWEWARATVGDGVVIVLAQRSLRSLGVETIEGNEQRLAAERVPRWFVMKLD